MQESNQSEVKLKGQGNLEPENFRPLLKYIYDGRVHFPSNPDNMVEFLGEAMFFNLDVLVHEVIQQLKQDEKASPKKWAFLLLPFACQFDMEKLKGDCCLRLEIAPDDTLKNDKEILNLPLGPLAELLSRDTFSSNEMDIFNCVSKWIKTAKEKGENPTTEDLKPLLDAVRLWNIPLDPLLDDVEPSKLYSETAIINAMKMRRLDPEFHDRGTEGNSLFSVDTCILQSQ